MKRFKKAKLFAATGAVFTGATFLTSLVQASSISWGAAPATGVLNTNTNWATNVLPVAADDVFFGASTQSALTLSANVTYFTITFNANAPAYTIGAAGGTQSITLGANGSPPTGGNITNNSSNLVTFNTPLAIRRGTINANTADILFTNTFNVGNNGTGSTTIGRNIDVTGSHNVTFAGQLLGTATVTAATPEIPDDDITNVDNGRLIKDGSGTLFLTNNGNNTNFTGPITINSGAVQANVANAFGANGTISNATRTVILGGTHVSGGTNTGRVELVGGVSFAPETLELEGRSVSDTQLLNVGGNNTWTGPVQIQQTVAGAGSYAIQSDAGTLTVSGNITNTTGNASARTLALRGASNGIITGSILEGTGSSNLSPFKDGAGTWVLAGSNNYTGTTTVNQGTLQIGNGGTSGNLGSGSVSLAGGNLVFNRTDSTNLLNPINGAGAVIVQTGTVGFSTGQVSIGALTVNDGAAISFNSSGPSATMTATSLTVGGANGSTLNFSLGIGGNPSAPILTTAGLARNGNNVVNLLGSNFSVGTITLIQNTGAETGTGSFTLGALPNRVLASIFDTGSKVDLDITGIDFPKWTGAVNNTWDTTINSNPKDWVLNSNGTTPTDYIEGDSVLFDDSSAVNSVNISNNVSPNAVTVNNSSKNYTFVGGGGIGGAATLTKTGTGTLTLANDGANTFTGAISIGAGGTLAIGAGTSSGNIGGGTITNSGHLVLNRLDGVSLPNSINGSGNLIVRAGSVGTLSGNNSYDGATTIESGGVLAVNSATALGTSVGSTVVQSGASLYAGAGGSLSYSEPIMISGAGNGISAGAIHAAGSGAVSTFSGPVTLGSSVTLFAESTSTGVLATSISGAGFDVTMDGGGTFTLAANGNAYNNTIVTNGTLSMGNGGTTGNIGSGTVSVASGGTFAINHSDAISFGTLISGDGAVANSGAGTLMLTGNNTFTGPVVVGQGVLRIIPSNLNGLGVGNKSVIAVSRSSGIELDGGVTLPSNIGLTLSNDGTGAVPFAVHSPAGSTNTINGDILIGTGSGNPLLKVDAGGTLIVNGNISSSTGTISIGLGGSGVGTVNGVISNGGGGTGLVVAGTGAPSWTLTAANTMTSNVSLQSGTLTLMNSQALGNTSGTFCFIGNGGGGFAGIPAALNIGTDGLTVPNNLWTNKDGGGLGAGESTERLISFTGTSGTGTFSGELQLNGGAVLHSTPNSTLMMTGVIHDGSDNSAGVKRDVFINSSGTIVFTNANTYSGFTEMDSGTLVLMGSPSQAVVLFAGGADIKGGRMVFDYTGESDPISSILPLLQTSLANGFLTGQIRSTTAANGIGIGYLDDNVSRLQLLRTYSGDANVDGTVNALDFNALATNFGASSNAQWIQGDFNYDGVVNTQDFNFIAQNFGKTLPAAPAPVLGSLVPEPMALCLLPLGAMMIRRRRSK